MNVEKRLAPMTGVPRRWLPWVVLIAPAIVAAILAIWGTPHGPGTNEDSETYVCAAQTLIEKHALLACGRNWPLVWFPPLYPTMLAALDVLGIMGLDGVRVICMVSFAGSTLLMGAMLNRATSSLLLSIIGELLFLTMGDIVSVHLYAMSEAPFVVLFLLSIFWLWCALEDDRTRWVVLAGCTAAAASLTRYTGASIVFTGAIAFVWYDDLPRQVRLRRTAIFLTAACAPLGIWMCRNLYEARTLTARTAGFYPLEPRQYSRAAYTVVRWFIPWLSEAACFAVGGPVIVAVLVAFALVIYWNPGKLVWLLAVFALSNVMLIVVSRLFLDPFVLLAERMLVPILVSLLIVTLMLVHSLVTKPAVNALWRCLAVSIAILCIAANAFRARDILSESRNDGLEMSRLYYRNSTLIPWLSRLPLGTVLYSDEPEPIYFATGRFAEQLPMVTDPESKLPADSTRREEDLLLRRLGDHDGFIVYFNEASAYRRDNMAPIDSMPAIYHLSMRRLLQNKEGAIYEMRADPAFRLQQ